MYFLLNRPAVRYALLSALFVSCFLGGISYGTAKARSKLYGGSPSSLRRTLKETPTPPPLPTFDSIELEQQAHLHAQCARGSPPTPSENRPLLLLKYSRTGSTWLAWTGNTLKLASGQPMNWVHEAQGCIRDPTNHEKANTPEMATNLATWFMEYFSRTTNGLMNGRSAKHTKVIDHKCLETVGKNPDELGVMVATLNPHVSHDETPDLTSEQWSDIFAASPDLAIGVLVRTNAVKRGISALASDFQKEICHSKKLHGDEDCIKNLPTSVHIDPHRLMGKIGESEMKRKIVTDRAAELSAKYGDGRIFCLSYEGMQKDLQGEMSDLGEFLAAPIDPESLAALGDGDTVSYKRGSDDLSNYVENYQEIRDLLASENPCLLEQLEATEPRTFPLCDVYVDEEE